MTSKREITVAGEPIWLCGLTGKVAADKKWSESRVHANTQATPSFHGGNPFVTTTVSTTVNTRHEFWLVAPDGEERSVELFDSRVSVREGQCVTAIWGAGRPRESGPYLMLRNHNAQSDHWLVADASTILKRMGVSDPFPRCVLSGGAAALLFWVLFHSGLLSLVLLAVSIGFGSHRRTAKARQIRAVVTEAMNLEVQAWEATAQNKVNAAGAGLLGN